MAFCDEVIIPGFELLTLHPFNKKTLLQELEKNPLELKKKLAFEVVSLVHSEKESTFAKQEFEKIFQKKQNPKSLAIRKIKKGEQLIDLLVKEKITSSKAEAKRLIKQGGIDLDGEKITDCTYCISEKGEKIIRCGKHKFIKIKCD
jgi:tyrosyl-tRNA synthetase